MIFRPSILPQQWIQDKLMCPKNIDLATVDTKGVEFIDYFNSLDLGRPVCISIDDTNRPQAALWHKNDTYYAIDHRCQRLMIVWDSRWHIDY